MDWNQQQSAALDRVAKWHKSKTKSQQVFKLMGYAGTGKTTLAKYLAEHIKGDTVFCAFTGKASLVMQRNGCKDASTIHSLIYNVRTDSDTGETHFDLNYDSDAKRAKLIVVDECSMVDESMGIDLMSFKTPILVLGDPAQLPPVNGAGYFVNGRPDSLLTEIHRQAENDPIIQLASKVRAGERLQPGTYGDTKIITRQEVMQTDVVLADQVLVGRNVTRENYNKRIREINRIESPYPVKGDRLICLRNDRNLGIFNGGMFEAIKGASPSKNTVHITVKSEDFEDRDPITIECRKECFTGGIEDVDWKEKKGLQEFTFGYAVTVHKAQGSQWDNIYLFDESQAFGRHDPYMPQRWLYTGITRAAKRQTIVV